MKKEQYDLIENHMLSCMKDTSHDRDHVYRVLYTALEIAETEPEADTDILIAACLLHDIARPEQLADSSVDHASLGADKAHDFLIKSGFSETFAAKVRSCIFTHRFRKSRPPESLEAKILFDADKLDVTGAMGIARTLIYNGETGRPLYSVNPDGSVSDGSDDITPTFFLEYKFKLEQLYGRFYTRCGEALALSRRDAAERFYSDLLSEIRASLSGAELLYKYIGQ